MTTTATAAIQADVTVATIRAWCRIGAITAATLVLLHHEHDRTT